MMSSLGIVSWVSRWRLLGKGELNGGAVGHVIVPPYLRYLPNGAIPSFSLVILFST